MSIDDKEWKFLQRAQNSVSVYLGRAETLTACFKAAVAICFAFFITLQAFCIRHHLIRRHRGTALPNKATVLHRLSFAVSRNLTTALGPRARCQKLLARPVIDSSDFSKYRMVQQHRIERLAQR